MVKNKKRVDLNTRPNPNPIFRNYDYGGPEDGGGAGPGTGLYHGSMDKYKSVTDFINKSRKRKKRKKSIAAVVLDLSKKLTDKNKKDEANTIVQKLQQSSPTSEDVENSVDELERMRQRKYLTELNHDQNVWQHRFSSVRKDDKGFYILTSDNPAGSLMHVGDTLSDEAINMTPYWSIISIHNNRVNLQPIGSNPFLTGVGAGGAKLTDLDVNIFTGSYEKQRLANIQKKLDAGTATIDDVKYILEGTVSLRMGPNGTEGGWYTPSDVRANKGGRSGLKTEQIVLKDAKTLQQLGFAVPVRALNGTMDTESWESWINGNGDAGERDYIPKDADKYTNFHKRMTDKGRYRYDQEGLQALKDRHNLDVLNRYWEGVIQDFLSTSESEFKIKHPYKPHNLKTLVSLYNQYKNELEKKLSNTDEYFVEGEDESEESILKHIFHQERRVAIRNTVKLIEMSKEDPKYIKYLHDLIKLGGTDWFANEKVLIFFDLTDDVDGLKLCAEHLKDPTNIRYALGYLANRGEVDYVVDKLESDGNILDLEVLDSALSNIDRRYKEVNKQLFGRDDWLLNYAKQHNLLDRLTEEVNKEHPHWKSSDIIALILRSFGPKMLWQPGEEELAEQYKILYNKLH